MERDQASEYAAAWTTFEALERVSPHRADWASWAAGRSRHTLFMALVRDAPASAAIHTVQRSLREIDGLELHEPHFFHISIQSCGFDDTLVLDCDRVEAALREVPSFEIVLGGVNAFHSAIFLETHSAGRLLSLRAALRRALGPALHGVDPHAGFLFHLTLGYLGERASLATVRHAIRPLRERDTARVWIDRVDLIQVPTDQQVPFPELSPLRSFALATVRRL